ncbi:MAG TPA: VOC family protein [Miltoncostaeaceae bacterium]|nr:VOC family protein [Miltoncostaeaceae bacterium]
MPATAPRMMFLNLPVADLERAKRFFGELGFGFNTQFTDDRAACMVVSDQAYVMLLQRDFFATFTSRPVADAGAPVEAIVALSAESREDVDDVTETALRAGGSPAREPKDHGFMYERSFHDPDGHLWEVVWMDPATLQEG